MQPTRRAATSKRSARPTAAPYAVGRSRIQGRGLFATRRIPIGTRIVRYTGERISSDDAAERYDDERARRHHTFLFAIDEDTLIDGRNGGVARLINHSCDPNCAADVRRGRVWVIAKREIWPGEELTIDYSYSTDESYTNADLRRLYPCRCGTDSCRGTIAALRVPTGRIP
jgi:SET domain-containing protein